jgi:protein phosphatase
MKSAHSVWALSHRGTERTLNQDSIAIGAWRLGCDTDALAQLELPCAANAPALVCLVADGMSGHPAGEVAASLAVSYLEPSVRTAPDAAAIRAALDNCHRTLLAEANAHPPWAGMGTAIAGVRIAGPEVWVFNVGDCRVYRLQDGFLHQLSIDDVVQVNGQATSRLTQVLGGHAQNAAPQPHVISEQALAGRRYLIASDGLLDVLKLDEIEAALAGPTWDALHQLRSIALSAGAVDNFSAVLIDLPSDPT